MLQSDMVESLNGIVRINDAEIEVVQQMVKYMYTAKIDHQFSKVKELLVLANKYQVLELVNYCSSKIFESLSEDNALEIGMFGEMHNSEILINRCAKYICYDMTDSLNQDWMEKIQESPKLMLQIIKNLRDVHENKGKLFICEICDKTSTSLNGLRRHMSVYHRHQPHAILPE
mgnify:CR=1 FL=1